MTATDCITEATFDLPARTNVPLHSTNSRLLAALAGHELREPAQAIQSFLSVVLDERTGPLNELQADFLTTANQAAKRLAQRIADVQLALNLDSNPFILNCEPVDLKDSAECCCKELALLGRCHDVRLRLDTSGWDNEGLICGDPDRVGQVLLNLIENGIRYARPGTSVKVIVRTTESGAGAIIIRNEVDLPIDDDPQTWFKPYERGAHRANPEKEGLGLGLTVVAYLMDAHRGKVTAHRNGSQISVGVIFPPARPPAPPAKRAPRAELSPTLVPLEMSYVPGNTSITSNE